MVAIAAVIAIALLRAGGASPAPSSAHAGARASSAAGATGAPTGGTLAAANARTRRPNIVFVLTDDLSLDLLRYMPEVQALESRGLTFDNYFVSDSLCCPSRASIFTGDYPHDTGVYTNSGPQGGVGAFFAHNDESKSFNVALQNAGYRTAMMGKYLNGYLLGPGRSPLPNNYVPPGWNEWDVAGWGYPEFDYQMNIDGKVRYFGSAARDYLTDVLARRGVRFIDRVAHSGRPFFLELATFAPHTPYVPAPRDARLFPGLKAPRPPNFNRLPINPPSWLAGHKPLTPGKIARINRAFRLRVQSVQAVDDMITKIEHALSAHRLLSNTYIVFSSDNGLHTGEYRLMPGKLTAFDTDIHVPLVIAGPGIAAGSTTDAMSENVDLAETFARIAGTSVSGDGHTLTGLFHGSVPLGWRNAVLIEHHGPAYSPSDPDIQTGASGNPPSYEALRTPGYLYVEYDNGEREFYDLRNDRYELDNLAPTLSSERLASLHRALIGLEQCHSGAACWKASHVAVLPAG